MHYFIKPYYFDPSLRPESDHWKNFRVSCKILVFFISIAIGVFVYVENTVEDHKKWWTLTEKVCPKLKQTDMLHYHNINGLAYCTYVPAFYLMKALNYNYLKWYKAYTPSEARICITQGFF